jgi:hypothetical protein
MIVTTDYDHHLSPAGYIVQLFGSFHFKSTPKKGSKKQKVTIIVAPISKMRPKKHLEFIKLVELLNSKNKKILRNIKAQWLRMLAPEVKIMNEYLLVEMSKDAGIRKPKKFATKCFQHLIDIQVLLGLAAILSML